MHIYVSAPTQFVSLCITRVLLPPVCARRFSVEDEGSTRPVCYARVPISRTCRAQLRKTWARNPRKEGKTFFIFRRRSVAAPRRAGAHRGKFSLKYRWNQSPARVAAIAPLFSTPFHDTRDCVYCIITGWLTRAVNARHRAFTLIAGNVGNGFWSCQGWKRF